MVKLQAKGASEITSLLYVPKNKAFLDKIILASFYHSVEQLTKMVLSDTSDNADNWIIDNYVALTKLYQQLAAELEEIQSMLEIVGKRIG